MSNRMTGEVEDQVVAKALKDFKASVDAWSEAAFNRPRASVRAARRTWRLAAGWAMAAVIAAGSFAGWMAERHHQQKLAQIAAERSAQKAAQQQAAAAQQPAPAAKSGALQEFPAATAASGDEDLLASVDNDISREVPAAMEPLAQLIDSNGTAQETQVKAGKVPLNNKGGETK